jgi:replication-associated recombination protein RarA
MVKRKNEESNSGENTEQPEIKKNFRPRIKLDNCPPVENLKDLINVGKTSLFYKNINVIMLWDILPQLIELDNMIGMESLKETIFYQTIYYLQNMHKKNKNEEYLHTIIMGSAGCGKTTVAKIIGGIYKNMGILSRDSSFTIGYRDDFVGEYLGQTATKTKKFLDSCLGGVLFIDEVYSLGPGQKDKDSYSKEAIDTICSYLSEHKNDFCCIIAGYEKDVKNCFLSVNSGLERRFPWVHIIKEYTSENLTDILLKLVEKTAWTLHEELDKNYLRNLFENKKELFKNAGGDIETFITKIKMAHSKRVFSMDKHFKFIINKEDINNALKIIEKYSIKEKSYTYNMYT